MCEEIRGMKHFGRRVLLIVLAAMVGLGSQVIPGITGNARGEAYGATMISSKLTKSVSVKQGDEDVVVMVSIENKDAKSFTFNGATLSVSPASNVVVTNGMTGTVTLEKGEKTTIPFYLDIGRYAPTGKRSLSLVLRSDGTVVHENVALGSMVIYEKLGTPENGTGNYVAALDMVHYTNPEEGFFYGQDNTLIIQINNFGNTIVKNAVLTLTLPEGITINNGSNSANLGYLSTSSTKETTFHIAVEDGAESKTYGITGKLTGLDYSNQAVSEEKIFYIPVTGSGGSLKNLEITNIHLPDSVEGDTPFSLSFEVKNQSSASVRNIKVSVEVPEGILNKTKNSFVESQIDGNSNASYSVTLFAEDGAKEKSYPIKITVSPSDDSDSGTTIVQYASVYVGGTGGSKTPQLMIESYHYGGSYVQAGDQFPLDLSLYNTSKNHSISNIKVTVTSEDGTFIPVNSSNSFYVDEMEKKGHWVHSLLLSAKPDAEQKTTALTIDMSYEDNEGNQLTSKDTISIPVMQETKLEVDEIVAPPDLYAGMQTGISVEFYNMGKTVLNNLRVVAEGDFDTVESTSYYAGNMESGKSDSYDFSFIPRASGEMKGKLIFTYEDASGDVQTLEKPFVFQVMEEVPYIDEEMPMTQPEGQAVGKIPFVLGGILLIGMGGIVTYWKIRKKKKLIREMEIDE